MVLEIGTLLPFPLRCLWHNPFPHHSIFCVFWRHGDNDCCHGSCSSQFAPWIAIASVFIFVSFVLPFAQTNESQIVHITPSCYNLKFFRPLVDCWVGGFTIIHRHHNIDISSVSFRAVHHSGMWSHVSLLQQFKPWWGWRFLSSTTRSLNKRCPQRDCLLLPNQNATIASYELTHFQ